MGAVTFSIDPALIACLASLANFDTFVETGTYQGDTVAIVRPYFQQIISIESVEALYQAASIRYANDHLVTLIHGKSDQCLGNLMPELHKRKVVFWLDAHWSAGPEQDDEQAQCTLLQELDAIHRLNKHSIILIDDARLFLSPPTAPHKYTEWPRLHEILAALQLLSSEHRLLILNDVMIFYPIHIEEGLYEFAHRCGVDWLSTMDKGKGHDHLLQDNLAKEAVIQQIRIDQRVSLFYWLRRIWLRTVLHSKTLSQYSPRPLHIPARYYQNSVQSQDPPVVSIVTPSYNQGHYLPRTIESILEQGYSRLEYVIQDGGSTDNTHEILEQYRSRLTHVTSAPDQGQADAINKGFQKSTGEIMAWCNSDDILLPGTIAYVVNFFQENPHVDIVYGHRIQIDANGFEIGRWVLPPHDEHVLMWADYVPQETLFWRRRIWQKVGGYVDQSYQFALDWELLLRFQHAGARFVRLPRFLAAFRVHDQQKTSAQLNTTGQQEMARLRTSYHGRQVSKVEVQYHIFKYLVRAAWLDKLVEWGIVQH